MANLWPKGMLSVICTTILSLCRFHDYLCRGLDGFHDDRHIVDSFHHNRFFRHHDLTPSTVFFNVDLLNPPGTYLPFPSLHRRSDTLDGKVIEAQGLRLDQLTRGDLQNFRKNPLADLCESIHGR